MRFHLRKATLADIGLLVEHRHRLFEEIHHRTSKEHAIADRSYKRWASKLMKKNELVGFIIETKDRRFPVASGCLWLREGPPFPGQPAGPRPYIMSVYTDPRYRRMGLASRIIREATRWCKHAGFSRLTLHSSKIARRVYKKLGWERTWEMQFRLDTKGHSQALRKKGSEWKKKATTL